MQQLTRESRIVFKKTPFYFFVLVALMLQACIKSQDTDLQKQLNADDAALQSYFKSQSLVDSVTKATGGYYYKVVTPNSSGHQVASNDILAIRYKVTVLGQPTAFEDSLTSGNPVKLRALTSTGALLPIGLDAGLGKMRTGETYRFYIPSTLAYGDYSYTAFPANSNLIIDAKIDTFLTNAQQQGIETDKIHEYLSKNNINNAVPTTSGLYYQKTQDGTGTTLPVSGNTVTLNYKGKLLDGTVFDSTSTSSFSFAIGANKVIPGFEEGIKLMHKGERGRIILPSALAYDASLQVIPQKIRQDLINQKLISSQYSIKPFSSLVFEIELVNIQ